MAGGGSPGDRSLKETPTWAVATVCAVFVIISILIEQGIHILGKWFQKRNKKALNEALEKIKAELMLLGFISLLLTVGSKPISMICITTSAGNTMLPCKKEYSDPGYNKDDRRKLLWDNDHQNRHRILAATGGGSDYCSRHNKVPLVSQSGMNQLHIFIFVLAVFHVLYSVITMALGRAKMKRWQKWESETNSLEYQFTNDPSRFRFAHQTSFVRRHASFSARTPGLRWIVAFFRQFFGSVTKVDYLTLRHGFINAHFAPNSKFDFHKYIKRSLEDDFKVVVGISFPLWIFATLFLLLNVYGWYTLLWISFIPLIILLLIGTKLEVIIMELALQIQERTTVVKGAPTVEPSNKFFWFNRPEWILFLLHFTLFQNAFQMSFFLWIWYQFGLTSCFNENLPAILVRVVMGLALQVVCSYITFPLYALVTQMGSHMKKAIFEEQTAKALRKWQKAAKERKKLRKGGADVPSGIISGETTPSQGSSPIHLLHKYRVPTGDTESVLNSPRSYLSDNEFSEMEAPPLDSHEANINNSTFRERDAPSGDFSFVQP